MDVKNLLGTLLAPQVQQQKVSGTTKALKSGSTTDRDGNGQMGWDQRSGEQKPPMTPEQLKAAIDHLKSLPAIKDLHLKVEVVISHGKTFVHLIEENGNILRRIPEVELWTLPIVEATSPDKKGQLIRKSA